MTHLSELFKYLGWAYIVLSSSYLCVRVVQCLRCPMRTYQMATESNSFYVIYVKYSKTLE